MRYLLACHVEGCHLCDFSARLRDSRQPILRTPKKNHSVAAPGAAEREPHFAELLYRCARKLNLLEPFVSEKADEAAVGRPEGETRALGAVERPGFGRIKRAHPELYIAASSRGEGQMTAIRRHSDLVKARLLRRQDGRFEDTQVHSRLACEVCPRESQPPKQQRRG